MPDAPPFFKWDPDGDARRSRLVAHGMVEQGLDRKDAEKAAERRLERGESDGMAGRRFLLRWGWVLATGVLVFGYAILAAVLTGHGAWLGL